MTVIDLDLECKTCGYNLRGLTPEGTCPECGKPVAESGMMDRLRYDDPAWVNRVWRGLILAESGHSLLLICVVATFGVFFLYLLGQMLIWGGGIASPSLGVIVGWFAPLLMPASCAALLAGSIGIAAGLFLVSSPRRLLVESDRSRAVVERATHIGGVTAMAGWIKVYNASVPYELAEVLAHMCAIFIFLHLYMALYRQKALIRRCAQLAFTSSTRLDTYRNWLVVIAVICFGWHWAGPERWTGNPWTPPAGPLVPGFMPLMWLILLGSIRATKEEVGHEIERNFEPIDQRLLRAMRLKKAKG